jgi:hypothetical protein
MAVITVYRCPQCNNNVEPVLKLICKPVLTCSQCRTPMRVHPGMVARNWTRGLYLWGVLICWLWMAGYAFQTQAINKPPAQALGFMIGVLLLGWLPGLLFALPLLLVGSVIGHIMAWRLDRPTAPTYSEYRDPDAYVPKEHDWR